MPLSNCELDTLFLLTLHSKPEKTEHWVKLFRKNGIATRSKNVQTPEQLEEALSDSRWSICLVEETLPSINAEQTLQTIARQSIDLPAVVLLPENPDKPAVYWLESGARDAIQENATNHVVRAVIREISAQKTRQQLELSSKHLKESEQRCELLLKSAGLAITYVHEGAHIHANDSYLKLLGYQDTHDLEGAFLIDLVTDDDKNSIRDVLKQIRQSSSDSELHCTMKDNEGKTFEVEMLFSCSYYDDEPCIQVIVLPATSGERSLPASTDSSGKQSEPRQLLNRTEFLQRLEKQPHQKTLVYLHLNNYDFIRSEFDAKGIIALQQAILNLMSKHLSDCQAAHFVDEVFLAATSTTSETTIQQLQLAIKDLLITTDNKTLHTSASIGYSLNEEKGDTALWLKQAEMACHISQQEEEFPVTLYSKQSVLKARANSGDKEAVIRQALEKSSFSLMFQPVISLTGEGEENYEVFIRLKNNNGENIPAADFIEIAENRRADRTGRFMGVETCI